MLLSIILKGALIGFAVAAPVGPVAIICIRRTLTQGRWVGMASGFGAATADFVYATIAALGFSAVSDYLISSVFWIRLIGGLLLCVWGFRALFIFQKDIPQQANKRTLVSAYLTTFFVTISNPMTVLVFIAIFSNFCNEQMSYLESILQLCGIFLGSILWFGFLIETIHFLRSRITYYILQITNKISGFLIIGFGLITIASAILKVCYLP